MTTRSDFIVAFDGPAVSQGTMDVRDLAPALLALGELVDAANQALNGEAASVRIDVKATSIGSFEVALEIVTSVRQQLTAMFSSDAVTAALQFKELIFLGGGGLFWLLHKLRGRTPKVERLENDTFRLTVDGESFVVPLRLMRLYQDYAVRRAAERAVAEPLRSEGIETVRFGDKATGLQITKADVPSFTAPELPEETLADDVRVSVFSIVSPVFKDDNKWRLYDGTNQISALIEDRAFLLAVDDNTVRFGKGDLLRCRVRVKQVRGREGLKSEYTVEKVLEHIPAKRQIELPFVGEDDDPPTGPR